MAEGIGTWDSVVPDNLPYHELLGTHLPTLGSAASVQLGISQGVKRIIVGPCDEILRVWTVGRSPYSSRGRGR